MRFRHVLGDEIVLLDLKAGSVEAVIDHAVEEMVSTGKISASQQEAVRAAVLKREAEGSTAIGASVAVPHAHLDELTEPATVFVRLARPLNLGAPDGVPTRFFFVLVGPSGKAREHLEDLMTIARLMGDEDFRSDALEAHDRAELLEAYDRFLVRTLPPGEASPRAEPQELVPTGRFCGGLIQDVRRRLPHYLSDFQDGFDLKTVAATLFLFFACLAPAVAFGGVMALLTEGQIGVIEMLLATTGCGVVYALFSGQPLTILGGTGPLLIFTGILYELCRRFGIPFLPTYCWVGFWSAGFMILFAATDASCLIRYFTRFTDETFAGLISLIFIYEAVKDLVHVFTDHEVTHDTALLSLVLAVGTYQIAMGLARFRRSPYLRPRMREFFADFGPAIALGAMTTVAFLLHQVELPRLAVPDQVTTTASRAWMVNPLSAPRWVWLAAAGPAFLASILIYLDQNITNRLVNSSKHRLHKGAGYHLDLAVVGVLIGVCSLFGLPWLVAATVRSLNHVRSLATIEEVEGHGGVRREHIIHVRENRLSPLLIHLLIGLSLLLLPVLRQIPMAVLFGLFLYMGVASMAGNQLFERLKLWLMEPALYPSTHYIRKVPIRTVHVYTVIQTVCLAVLWVVKTSTLGILFPLFIGLLIPVRMWLMPKLISPASLAVIDADEDRIIELEAGFDQSTLEEQADLRAGRSQEVLPGVGSESR